MRNFGGRNSALRLPLAALGCLAVCPAIAQVAPPAPSQVTPQSLAPQPAAPPPPLVIQGAPAAQAPAGAENIRVAVGDVTLDNGYADLAAQTAALVAPYRGQTRNVAQLYELAARIEAAYNGAGYILARVVVPPQSVNDGGVLRLQLIDGYIEAVDTAKVPARVRARVQALLQPLVGVRRIRLSRIERALTLAGTVPGVRLRSALAPGAEAGGTRLVIEAEYKPVNGTLATDNRVGPLFGGWSLTAQASFNSLLGWGEQIYLFLSGAPDLGRAFDDNARRRVAGAGMTLPVGDNGLTATVEGTIADTKPVVPGAFFQSNGLFRRLNLRLSYPLIQSRGESLSLTGGFEYASQREAAPAFSTVLDEDRLNVVRLSANWSRGFAWGGNLELFGQYSQGLSLFGVRTIRDVLATGIGFSRFGVSPNFGKAEAALSYSQLLPGEFAFSVRVRGQKAIGGGAVPSSELFSLDGEDAVSSLTSEALSGDGGVVGRLEVSRSIVFEPAALLFTPYIFGGAGTLFEQFRSPATITKATNYGVGLRVRRTGSDWFTPTLGVEFGYANAGPASGTRLMVNAGVHF